MNNTNLNSLICHRKNIVQLIAYEILQCSLENVNIKNITTNPDNPFLLPIALINEELNEELNSSIGNEKARIIFL